MAAQPSHNVLVVEDEASIRDLVQEVLEEAGYGVVAVADGAAAIQVLEVHQAPNEHFCVVFLDLMLPRVSGLDVLRYLQEHAEAVPVVAMSASRSHLAQAILAGARVAVAKPFEIDELLSLVANHCPRSHG